MSITAEGLIDKARGLAESHILRSGITDPLVKQAVHTAYSQNAIRDLHLTFSRLADMHAKATQFKRESTRSYYPLHSYSLGLDVTVGFTVVEADPDAGITKAYPSIEEVWVGSQNIGPLLSADQDEKLTEELQGLLAYEAMQNRIADRLELVL